MSGETRPVASGTVAATPKAQNHQPWRRRARTWVPHTSAGMPSSTTSGRGNAPMRAEVQSAKSRTDDTKLWAP